MRALSGILLSTITFSCIAAEPSVAAQKIKDGSIADGAKLAAHEARIAVLEARIAVLEGSTSGLTREDQMRKSVDAHIQVYEESCIPMSVELVLMLAGRVPPSNYDLQFEWRKKPYGTFETFVGRTLGGLTFQRSFTMPRSLDFPFERLFAAIDTELDAGRFVIIGLRDDDQSPFHAWVIAQRAPEGEYRGFTKFGAHTVEVTDIKERIRSNGGTEIGTYAPAREKPNSEGSAAP